jgi:hypothetical protein
MFLATDMAQVRFRCGTEGIIRLIGHKRGFPPQMGHERGQGVNRDNLQPIYERCFRGIYTWQEDGVEAFLPCQGYHGQHARGVTQNAIQGKFPQEHRP